MGGTMKPTATAARRADPSQGTLRRNLLLFAGYLGVLALIARGWL